MLKKWKGNKPHRKMAATTMMHRKKADMSKTSKWKKNSERAQWKSVAWNNLHAKKSVYCLPKFQEHAPNYTSKQFVCACVCVSVARELDSTRRNVNFVVCWRNKTGSGTKNETQKEHQFEHEVFVCVCVCMRWMMGTHLNADIQTQVPREFELLTKDNNDDDELGPLLFRLATVLVYLWTWNQVSFLL